MITCRLCALGEAHTHTHMHTAQFNVQRDKKITFKYLAIKLPAIKKERKKALKCVHLVCFCFFFNLTPSFKLPLLGTAESGVSCEEDARRLLPTSSSPSGCFPPTSPAWTETPQLGFSPLMIRRKWLKRDVDHSPGRKKKNKL